MSRASVAAGLGLGAFVANLPVYPVQTVVAVYLAKRLNVHPVAAVAGSQAAFPPFNVILSAAAIWLGHLILWQSTPAWTDFTERTWDFHGVRTLMEQYFFAWALGGVLIGVVMGAAVFLLAWLGLKWMRIWQQKLRNRKLPRQTNAGMRSAASIFATPSEKFRYMVPPYFFLFASGEGLATARGEDFGSPRGFFSFWYHLTFFLFGTALLFYSRIFFKLLRISKTIK